LEEDVAEGVEKDVIRFLEGCEHLLLLDCELLLLGGMLFRVVGLWLRNSRGCGGRREVGVFPRLGGAACAALGIGPSCLFEVLRSACSVKRERLVAVAADFFSAERVGLCFFVIVVVAFVVSGEIALTL
jgi:hypothetical protein